MLRGKRSGVSGFRACGVEGKGQHRGLRFERPRSRSFMCRLLTWASNIKSLPSNIKSLLCGTAKCAQERCADCASLPHPDNVSDRSCCLDKGHAAPEHHLGAIFGASCLMPIVKAQGTAGHGSEKDEWESRRVCVCSCRRGGRSSPKEVPW